MHRRIIPRAALAATVTATSLFALAPDAYAGTSCTMPLCGIVNNLTNNQITIDNGNHGRAIVYPGEGSRRYMADVDGFTFHGTSFIFLGLPKAKGEWIRVRDGMWITCKKVPGTIPVCTL